MWRTAIRACGVAAAVCSVSACVYVKGADFATRYTGTCGTSGVPFAAGVVQAGPGMEAVTARLVDQVGDQTYALRKCYEEALANVPRMQGKVVLGLTLSPRGALDRVSVLENTTNYEAFSCCVVAVVRNFSWPPSAAGASFGLKYPFTFGLVRMPTGFRPEYIQVDFEYTSARSEGYKVYLDGQMFGDP
jgi:hypothetical protein